MSHSKPSEVYLDKLRQRYAQARRKERSQILDEFVATTGYHRKHAVALLRGTRRHRDPTKRIRRPRARYYTAEDQRAALDAELAHLRQRGQLRVSRVCFQHLTQISPATMDRIRRMFRPARRPTRGGTKPGTLLKQQIAIRTFAAWDDKRPGFTEIDLVQHDGGNISGIFAYTLNVTDVCTGWTEMRAVPSRGQTAVFAALQLIRTRLPFPLLGIDSDNGGEFINDELYRYCVREKITFTRSRAGRKNDQPFVEQKNWSVIRHLVGYARYATPQQVKLLNALYEVYRQFANHFLPVTKLQGKERVGARIKRIFDKPKTPYQRVVDSTQVSAVVKARLRAEHATLDLVALKQQIDELKAKLQATVR